MAKNKEKVILQIERAAGPPMDADLTYQLALCKHEQAERLAHRPGTSEATARDAWTNAAGWWDRYLSNFSSRPWVPPAQIAHAKMLLAEARTLMAADLMVRVFELPSPEQLRLFDSLELRGARRTDITETISMLSAATRCSNISTVGRKRRSRRTSSVRGHCAISRFPKRWPSAGSSS